MLHKTRRQILKAGIVGLTCITFAGSAMASEEEPRPHMPSTVTGLIGRYDRIVDTYKDITNRCKDYNEAFKEWEKSMGYLIERKKDIVLTGLKAYYNLHSEKILEDYLKFELADIVDASRESIKNYMSSGDIRTRPDIADIIDIQGKFNKTVRDAKDCYFVFSEMGCKANEEEMVSFYIEQSKHAKVKDELNKNLLGKKEYWKNRGYEKITFDLLLGYFQKGLDHRRGT